jgi:hypothetical protein
MLLFNIVLKVIVRGANLQTTGKHTNLQYADIVGRSHSAVRDA